MESRLIPEKNDLTDRIVGRLVAYRRLLMRLMSQDVSLVSSKAIGDWLGIKSSQVRKDLSYLGEFGKRGVGYSVPRLLSDLSGILSPFSPWQIGLVGLGHLGEALLGHSAFFGHNYEIVAAFDVNLSKVGHYFSDRPCYDLKDMPSKIAELGIGILMVTTPASVAQKVVDLGLTSGKIIGVLNFSTAKLSVPDGVEVVDVDITVELEKLLFRLKLQEQRRLFDQ